MKKFIILCVATCTLISSQHMFGMLRNLPKKLLSHRNYCTAITAFNYTQIILQLNEENHTLKQEISALQQKLASRQTTEQNLRLPTLTLTIPLEEKNFYLEDRDIHYGNMNKDYNNQ